MGAPGAQKGGFTKVKFMFFVKVLVSCRRERHFHIAMTLPAKKWPKTMDCWLKTTPLFFSVFRDFSDVHLLSQNTVLNGPPLRR